MDKIPTGTWVVVADGGGARLFTNVGTEREISLRQDELIHQQDLTEAGGPGDMSNDMTKLPEIGELPKTLTNSPLPDIERALLN